MQAVLDWLNAEDAGLPDPTTLPPEDGRALAARANDRWNRDLPEMAEARDIVLSGLPGRWLVPVNDMEHDAILYIHGGGWAFCSAASHEGAARRLARATGAAVVTFDYRLSPEAPYPAGLDDCETAWTALAAMVPNRRLSVSGDSAGANLALALMFRLTAKGLPPPAQGLLFYGVYGADFDSPSYVAHRDGPGLTRAKMQRYWDWYAPEAIRDDPYVAPLAAPDAMLAALPPLYLSTAEIDPLRSDTEALFARLAELGRDDTAETISGVVHGFMQMGSVLPEAQDAFDRAGRTFMNRAAS